jgi:hypothetical protein
MLSYKVYENTKDKSNIYVEKRNGLFKRAYLMVTVAAAVPLQGHYQVLVYNMSMNMQVCSDDCDRVLECSKGVCICVLGMCLFVTF